MLVTPPRCVKITLPDTRNKHSSQQKLCPVKTITVDNAISQGHLVSKYGTNFLVYYLRIEIVHVECVNLQRPSRFHGVRKNNVWVHAAPRFQVRLSHICVQNFICNKWKHLPCCSALITPNSTKNAQANIVIYPRTEIMSNHVDFTLRSQAIHVDNNSQTLVHHNYALLKR